jgi:hypothetical protein
MQPETASALKGLSGAEVAKAAELVNYQDGAEIMICGQPHQLQGGEMILMPAGQPHALKALKRFKMILTMIRSEPETVLK